MNNQNTLSEIINNHIKDRGKTVKEVAAALDINIKTFYDELQHDRISAYKLLDLASYLDIDFEDLKLALGYTYKQSYYNRLRKRRMCSKEREKKKTEVLSVIRQMSNECDIDSVKDKLKKYYNNSTFFLLDVLLEEDYEIIEEFTSEDGGNDKKYFSVKIDFRKVPVGKTHNLSMLERKGETVLKEFIKQYLEKNNDIIKVTYDCEILEVKKQIESMNFEDLLDLGMDYHNERKYNLAVLCFLRILEIFDNTRTDEFVTEKVNACRCIALAFLASGDNIEAEKYLNKALSYSADDTFSLDRLLEIYKESDNFSKSVIIINELLQQEFSDFSFDELYALKLGFLSKLSDWRSELQCCKDIIKNSSDPDFRKFARNKIGILHKSHQEEFSNTYEGEC